MGYITTTSFSSFEEKHIDPLTIAGSLTQVPKFMQGITEAVAFSALSFFFFSLLLCISASSYWTIVSPSIGAQCPIIHTIQYIQELST